MRAGDQLVAVVTQPDRPAGRGHKLAPTAVEAAALALGAPVFMPTALRAFAAELQALGPDLCVVASYGRIVPQALLDAVPLWLNVHPSLLPLYRGATPIQSALRDGCRETGVTIIAMDAGMDTGDIVAQTAPLAIADGETYGELHDRLARAAGLLAGRSDRCARRRERSTRAASRAARATVTRPLVGPDRLLVPYAREHGAQARRRSSCAALAPRPRRAARRSGLGRARRPARARAGGAAGAQRRARGERRRVDRGRSGGTARKAPDGRRRLFAWGAAMTAVSTRPAPRARDVAFAVVRDVFGPAQRGAVESLDYHLRKNALDGRDRAFATELAYGTIERRRWLDHQLAPYLGARATKLPAMIAEILRLGTYQLRAMRVHPYAAVSESVQLARKFGHPGTAGLVNAVLRRVSSDPERPVEESAYPERDDVLGTRYSLPTWLLRSWRERFGGVEHRSDLRG